MFGKTKQFDQPWIWKTPISTSLCTLYPLWSHWDDWFLLEQQTRGSPNRRVCEKYGKSLQHGIFFLGLSLCSAIQRCLEQFSRHRPSTWSILAPFPCGASSVRLDMLHNGHGRLCDSSSSWLGPAFLTQRVSLSTVACRKVNAMDAILSGWGCIYEWRKAWLQHLHITFLKSPTCFCP